jgi:predicted MFS family arabinose efflux permease
MLLAYGVGAIAGAQASGRLTDHYGGVRVLTIGYIILSGTLAALGGIATFSIHILKGQG